MPDIQEEVMRELMRDATSDLFAPRTAAASAIRHERRRQFRSRMIGAGATAAVAGLAVGVVLTTSGGAAGPAGTTPAVHNAQLTAAQQTLYSLSSAAAGPHQQSGRYVIMTEKTVSGGESGPKTSVIDTVTGSVVTYQDIALSAVPKTPQPPAVLKSGPGSVPTQADLNAYPTSPAKLRAELLALARQQVALAQSQAAKKNPGGKTPPVSQSTDDDLVFSGATNLLWQPNLSPVLRSALYKVLATTPGVKVSPHAQDSAGRPAVEISRVNDWGKANVMTFENPKTGATLETASKLPAEGVNQDLYLSIKYSNSVPGNPYQR